jgi:NarL family two-component system sensor histidine kinase LiaS
MEHSINSGVKTKGYLLKRVPLPRLFQRLLPFFRRLQWKLTLAYTLSTLITILVLGLIALAILWYINYQSNLIPQTIADGLNKATPLLTPYLEQTPPDRAGLNNWLQQAIQSNNLMISIPKEGAEDENDTIPAQFGRVGAVVIVDQAGKILAARPAAEFEPDTLLQSKLSPEALSGFQAALQGETKPSALAIRDAEDYLIATAPIFGADQQVLGAIFVKLLFPIEAAEYLQMVFQRLILPFAGIMLVVGLVVGSIFGFLVARNLARRLQVLASASDAWSIGNFDVLVPDSSGDELGHLTRHLNHMVIELQNLFQTRQELAGLEERNRLARDLHDSVKQQIFATAMQVGAARTLIDQHPAEARTHLVEAEQLVRQAQQELTILIQELRPAALEGKGLAKALQEYTAIWSRQTHIAAEVRVSGERPLPLASEQTLFRVAQEALANIARHSHATAAEIYLGWESGQVKLVISDNGRGFNVAPRLTGKGVGLQSMSERMVMLGGHLHIESKPGGGTKVIAQLANID